MTIAPMPRTDKTAVTQNFVSRTGLLSAATSACEVLYVGVIGSPVTAATARFSSTVGCVPSGAAGGMLGWVPGVLIVVPPRSSW